MLTHIHPSRVRFTAGLVLTLRELGIPAQCLGQSRNRRVPRAPLLALGVTRGDELSGNSSEGVTPPSSLIRTHASDQNPPYRFRFPYTEGLCRLSSDPCWKMALPDVISAVCVRVLGPIPRRVPADLFVWTPLHSARTLRSQNIGLTSEFSTRDVPCNTTSTGGSFEAAVIR